MSKLLSVDHGTQKGSLWLKAFLVLDACIKGVQPFVGIAMQRLHDKVVAIVKENVKDDMGECADGDWDCSFCTPADGEAHFTEDSPLVMKICSMDTSGVADVGSPHCLKPHALMPCTLKGIPASYFHDSELVSPKTCMFICRNPADPADNTEFKSSTVLLLRASCFDSNAHHCQPFHVTRCCLKDSKDPELQFYAVLCSSRPAHTKQLVVDPETPKPPGLSFGFWALKLRDSESKDYFEFKHGLKEGNVIRFSGTDLPPGVADGSLYIVTVASSFSFQVAGPILRPVMALAAGTGAGESRFVVIRTSPVAR
jgi:hypothetical protein